MLLHDRAPARAQRSGSCGERMSSGISEFLLKAETSAVELVRTKEQGISRMLTINLNDVEKELKLR